MFAYQLAFQYQIQMAIALNQAAIYIATGTMMQVANGQVPWFVQFMHPTPHSNQMPSTMSLPLV